MKLAIATTARTTHIPGRFRDSSGRYYQSERTRCGTFIGRGWYIVEANEDPTCGRCRALAEHDRGTA